MARRPQCSPEETAAWFAGRIPNDWFETPVRVQVDRDEILVIGRLAQPERIPKGADAAQLAAEARISGFREETRAKRMAIADSAQSHWRRIVSWAAECGNVEQEFATAAVPVMTRLKLDQRKVLDTLIDAGVARSRSEALGWCVDQVAEHQSEWMDRLRDAMTEVERIRTEGP